MKLTIKTSYFILGENIYPKGSGKFKLVNDEVGFIEHGERGFINMIHFSQWKKEDGTKYATLDELLKDIAKILSYDKMLIGADFMIDYNLKNSLGSDNANVNGSITPVVFESVASRDSLITEFRIYIEDNGTFDDGLFGNLPALSNGCVLMLNGQPAGLFKTNTDLVLRSTNSWSLTTLDSANRNMVCQRLFSPHLSLLTGQKIQFIVRDNLTGLVKLNFGIRGYKI